MPDEVRCNFLALRQASRRVTQLYDRALAPSGLRATQYSVLATLQRGPVLMKTLAAELVLDRATLGHNLRPIEGQGLVDVTVAPDRRGRIVALSDAGQARLGQARPLWEKVQAAFERETGPAEAAALRAMLGRIAGHAGAVA